MTAARMYNHQHHSQPSSGLRYVSSAPSRNDHASLAAAAPIPPASMFFPSNFPSVPPPFLGGGGPAAAVGGSAAAGGLPLPHPTRHPPYHNDPAAPLMPRGPHTTTATAPPVLQQPNASLHPHSHVHQHPPHAGGNPHHPHPAAIPSHPPPPPPPSDRMRILMGGGGSAAAAAMLPPPPGMGGGLPFPPYPVLSSPPFLHHAHLHTMMPLHPSLVLTDSRRRTNDSGGPRSHRTPRNSPPPPVQSALPHQYHTSTRTSTTVNKSSQSTGAAASADPAAIRSTTAAATSGGAGGSTVETNPKRLRQRVKQLCFGRVTEGYKQYRRLVPRRLREKENELHPSTPVETTICSKRQWDAVVANWRRALHKWDTVHDASVMSLGGPHVVYQNGSTEPSDPALLLEEDVECELKRYQELLEWVHAEGDGDDGEGGDSPPPPPPPPATTTSALSLDPEAVMAAMSSPPARGTTTEEGTTSPSAAPLVVATPLASIHIPRPWDLKHNRTPAVRGTSNPSQESTPVMHRTPCRPSAKAAARHSTITSHQDPLLIADPSAAPEQAGPSNNSLGSVRSASVSMSPSGEYFDSVKIEVVELSEEPNDEAKYAVTGREVLYLDQSSATSVFENLKRKQFAVDRTFVCMLQRTPQASDPEGSHKLKVQLAQRKPIALQRGGADLPQFVALDQLQLLLSSVETVQKWLDDSERPRLFFRGALPIRQRPIDDVHMLSDSVHRQDGTGGNASQPSEAACHSHNITFSPSGLYALSPTSLTHNVHSSLSASSHRNPMMMTPMAQLRVTPSFFATTGVHQSSHSGVASAWPRSPVPSAESPVALDGGRRHDDDPQQRQREGLGGSSPLFLPTPITPSQQP